MRYIAIGNLRPDPAWIKAANDAASAVRKAKPEDRSKVIKDHDHVWKLFKDALHTLSHQKCWYCESIDVRSDNAVDHYRPKGNVRGATPRHGGYWWLAFEWSNYRFSCTYCNSIRKSAGKIGGKQDYFPLWDESKRARSDLDSIDDELPLLLDPTKVSDVRLLAFAEDGSVGPAVSPNQEREYKGAEESKTRYHLMHPDIVEMRVVRLREVLRWVEEADKNLARYIKTKEPFALSTAENRLKDVMAAVAPGAPYSAAAKHLLAGMPKSDAAKQVLETL
jgi:hypothetical protein